MSTKDLSSSPSFTISFLLILYAISSLCKAQNNAICTPSSCGKIHHITYPFRLKSDPKNCGKRGFELDCQNNHTTVTFKSKTYHIQSINYNNYTIRLVDPGLESDNICSYPNYTFDYNDVPNNYYTFIPGKLVNDFDSLNKEITFVKCLNPVMSPRYINSSLCANRTNSASNSSMISYTYIILRDDVTVSEFEESCNTDTTTWASVRGPIVADNGSLVGIHAGLAYGFELSWYRSVLCEECDASRGTCIVGETYEVTCRYYCYEDTPYEEKTFRCKLDYLAPFFFFYGLIGIGGILAIRFIIGLFCLGGLIRYQWKRRHLNINDGETQDFLHAQDNKREIS